VAFLFRLPLAMQSRSETSRSILINRTSLQRYSLVVLLLVFPRKLLIYKVNVLRIGNKKMYPELGQIRVNFYFCV